MPRLSEDLKKLIVSDRISGMSFQNLADKYKISKSTAKVLFDKFIKTGSVKNLPGCGRKRNTTAREDILLVREVTKNPTKSAKELKEEFNLNVSLRTIQKRLREGGLINCYQRRKPLINAKNKRKRLDFVKEHEDKDNVFWNSVLWSDESKFELYDSKKRKRVWRGRGEGLKDRYLKKTVKHGGGSIMVWGCFAANGVGELVLIEGIMKGADYVNILENNLKKSVKKLHLGSRYVFQQDNDPKHTSKVAENFFTKHKIKNSNGLHKARI